MSRDIPFVYSCCEETMRGMEPGDKRLCSCGRTWVCKLELTPVVSQVTE